MGALLALFFLLLLHGRSYARLLSPAGQQSYGYAMATPLLLQPVESTAVELHTHVVEVNVVDTGGGTLRLQTAAQYRLRNPGDAGVSLFVRLAPSGAASDASAPPTEVSLQVDGQPVVLQQAESTGYSAQIEIAPDAERTVLVQYAQDTGDVPLLTLAYPAGELNRWRGSPSLRVSLSLPESVTPASIVHIQPDTWSYAMSSNVRQPDIQWLYDATLPPQPFIVQLVPPRYWQEIQNARQVATGGDLNAALRLGELYTDLYASATSILASSLLAESASARGAEEQLAQQFYAQAVAAFSAGIDSAGAADAPEIGMLHGELARLYRSQIIGANGQINTGYAQLLVQEAEAALAVFNAQPAQRQELVQWLHEGLHTMYAAARDRGDWAEALNLLQRMETAIEIYGGGILSPEQLEEERRVITMQQALLLLEQENRTAAMALAGDALNNVSLAPPPASQSLFTAWQITATVATAGMRLDVLAQPVEEQWAAASAATQQTVQAWQSAGFGTEFADRAPQGLAFALTLPEASDGSVAADALPGGTEWALLRHLLSQLQPTVTETPALFQQNTVIRQPLDLRSVGDQWRAVASSLERQVAQFRAIEEGDTASTEEALQAQIQAIAYQDAANIWHALVQNSWVLVELTGATGASASAPNAVGGQPLERTWMSTVTTPPQELELRIRQFSAIRLLLATIVVVAGIFFLSGLLWWLL